MRDQLVDRVELVLADVHDREHRLHGEEERGREQLALVVGELGAVERRAVAEDAGGLLQRRDLARERLVALGRAPLPVEAPLDRRQVGEHQLELERVEVVARDRCRPCTDGSSNARST